MKRVRTEQIQMAVSCYLKRRQYVDSDGALKQGLRLSQTAEEMAANLTGNRAGRPWRSCLREPAGRPASQRAAPDGWLVLASETLPVHHSHTKMPLLNTSLCRMS